MIRKSVKLPDKLKAQKVEVNLKKERKTKGRKQIPEIGGVVVILKEFVVIGGQRWYAHRRKAAFHLQSEILDKLTQ